MVVFGGIVLIVSSTSVEQCLSTIGTWIRAFDGFCSLRNARGWFCVAGEKIMGGGGHNNFHRGILKVPVKLFF